MRAMKPDNPFLIRGYAGPEWFCDRAAETDALVSALGNGRDVTLVAPRRYGKTGLIKNAFQRLAKTHATVYLDIFAVPDLASFVRAFSSAVLGRLDSTAQSAGRKLLSFFKSCRPTMTPQEDGSFAFSFDLAPSRAEATLKETFDYLASRGRRTAIAIDEFQQVRNFPEKGVEGLLRSYVQFVPSAHFVFAGSKRHMMEEMFVSPKGPFYQSTQLMALGPIDRGKYADFAARFFRKDGRAFETAAFEHLYDRFDGVTWYVQAVLNRTWAAGGGLVSAAQVDEAVDGLVEESSLFFHDLLNSQTPAERAVLKAIGRDGAVPAVTAAAFLRRHGLPAASTVRSAAANLEKRDLLYRTDGGFIVYDRLFGAYLSRL
jgi:hypothetical protein